MRAFRSVFGNSGAGSKATGLALLALAVLSLPALAAAPMPDIPKGKGDKCVEDTKLMRSNHMEFLLHQRDETVHLGIRTKRHSLKECISCHAVTGADGQAISVANPKHFCRACHDYASVKIDCFECHASKPKSTTGSSL
jgi:predicted CXXCH cytochrome family protein